MAQLLSNFGADLTGLRQGASCAAREKTPSFLQPIRVCRHALVSCKEGTASEDLRKRSLLYRPEYSDFPGKVYSSSFSTERPRRTRTCLTLMLQPWNGMSMVLPCSAQPWASPCLRVSPLP